MSDVRKAREAWMDSLNAVLSAHDDLRNAELYEGVARMKYEQAKEAERIERERYLK